MPISPMLTSELLRHWEMLLALMFFFWPRVIQGKTSSADMSWLMTDVHDVKKTELL
jgi:hypothetical protein